VGNHLNAPKHQLTTGVGLRQVPQPAAIIAGGLHTPKFTNVSELYQERSGR
jgi:hypothetical protein